MSSVNVTNRNNTFQSTLRRDLRYRSRSGSRTRPVPADLERRSHIPPTWRFALTCIRNISKTARTHVDPTTRAERYRDRMSATDCRISHADARRLPACHALCLATCFRPWPMPRKLGHAIAQPLPLLSRVALCYQTQHLSLLQVSRR